MCIDLGKARYLAYCERQGVEPVKWEDTCEAFKDQWRPKPMGRATESHVESNNVKTA